MVNFGGGVTWADSLEAVLVVDSSRQNYQSYCKGPWVAADTFEDRQGKRTTERTGGRWGAEGKLGTLPDFRVDKAVVLWRRESDDPNRDQKKITNPQRHRCSPKTSSQPAGELTKTWFHLRKMLNLEGDLLKSGNVPAG